ncbi:MAG TPA: hydrolase, partial [Bradyrhizobium sp.]|nr:hydrolase [Bradyrhizobium sp.]
MQSSTKGFELIISDCDGVLVDSEPIINRAHAQMLTACGYSITEEWPFAL